MAPLPLRALTSVALAAVFTGGLAAAAVLRGGADPARSGANATMAAGSSSGDLDVVEKALRAVENAPMGPEQKQITAQVVADVQRAVDQLEKNATLTKDQRRQTAKLALDRMKGLQSLWALASVEDSLGRALRAPGMAPKLLARAKQVVSGVDAVVDDIESGKLPDGAARRDRLGSAIQSLAGLEREMSASAKSSSKLDKLEQQLAEKKALLAKAEKELKVAGVEKELLEKKQKLEQYLEEKREAQEEKRLMAEGASQKDAVAKLIATAKSIAEAKGFPKATAATSAAAPEAAAPTHPDVKSLLSKQTVIQSIVSSLKAQAQNVTSSIARLDADEKQREDQLQRSMQAPTTGEKDALARGQALLKMLDKGSRRSYQKARAIHEAELRDLEDGIRSIESGDVAALTRLMAKMQGEAKTMQAKSNNFLY